MAKLVSITTALLLLIQSFNVHFDDLVELDELIEHAQFHADQYGDSFLVFLSKHYGELKADHDRQHQEERDQHEQLPFQNQCQSLVFFTIDFGTPFESIAVNEMGIYRATNFHYQASYPSLAQKGQFQPPRQA